MATQDYLFPPVAISDLPHAVRANLSDRIEANQQGVSRSVGFDQIQELLQIGGPPSGPAGGALSGSYPDPLLKPSATNGQVMTTVGGIAQWANPAAGGGSVSSVSVVSANGLAGTVATPTLTPAITLSTTITGMLKGNGTAILAGVAGTDYVTPGDLPTSLPPSGVAGGDLSGSYPNPTIKPSVTNGQVLTTVAGVAAWAAPAASGGSVTSVSVVSANGLAGTVATPTLTPAITLSTTVTGMLKGNGTAISAAIAGTDYVTPAGIPASLPPSGAAAGDLAGTYPNPTIKPSVNLTGTPLSTTPAVGVTSTEIVTAAWVLAKGYTANAGTVTTVAVVNANGFGASIVNASTTPTITLSTTITGLLKGNGTAISAAVAGTDYLAPGSIPLTTGAVGYGAAGVLTGVAANLSFDAANKRLGINKTTPAASLDIVIPAVNSQAVAISGYSLTGANATGCFGIDATLNTTGAPEIFRIDVTDPGVGSGNENAFVIRYNGNSSIRAKNNGTLSFSGSSQAFLNTGLPTNGADFFAYWLGNNSGGNIGLYAGLSNPTFSTFGRFGSIYLNGASPGLPYYNNNGTTGWDRLVGETSTQTITNKTFGATTFTGAVTGTTATFSGTVSAPGTQIQMVSVETGAVATGTTVIPVDDTIPQITEGDQYMTLAITPKSATSKLIIEIAAQLSHSVSGATIVAALFQDATAGALAAMMQAIPASGAQACVSFRHVMTSGTTSATTFRVRAGTSVAGTTTFNGSGGARFMGGVLASSIVIREIV